MSVFFKCIYGPELYRIYRSGSRKGDLYSGNAVERYSSTIMSSINAALSVSIYISPIILGFLYRRNFYNLDGLTYICKFVCGTTLIYLCAFYVRGIGRVFNPVYRQFIDVHPKAVRNLTPENKALLASYDFHFKAWPVEFSTYQTGNTKFLHNKPQTKTWWQTIKDGPKHMASLLLLHSFGIKLIYPGSIQLLQASISSALQDGRAQLILEKGGKRHKVVSSEGNDIDTIFFDRREVSKDVGQTLVISCDGNAGFYEIGVLATPLEAGYSVLGWNHPGFAGSSGSPYSQDEANAVDSVMQFAIQKLGFRPEQIIVHGWSIGGFTASCLAMNYPEIKGVVIDASFDQLLPLAVPRMPQFLEPLVTYAVSNFVSLKVADQLKQYSGPIRIVRRRNDEMVTTDMNFIEANRGNSLLLELLKHRYPHLCTEENVSVLWKYLALDEVGQSQFRASLNFDEENLLSHVTPTENDEKRTYPSDIGANDTKLNPEQKQNLLLTLAKLHLEEVDSIHCSPLPKEKFHLPPF